MSIDKFFSYTKYDYCDYLVIQFYTCVLKEPIGPFLENQKIDCITIDFERLEITMWENVGNTKVFEGTFEIGNIKAK